MSVRCFIVEDHDFMREGLAAALRSIDEIELIGAAGSIHEALAHKAPVDVVLLDLGLPDICRRSAVSTLMQAWPHVGVLVITGFANGPDVVQAFAEGTRGYVTKNVRRAELATAIRRVAEGGIYVTPLLAGHLLSAGFELSQGERAVLRLVAEGMADRQIAETLHISNKTVENRLVAVRIKAGLVHRPRSALARFAYESDQGCQLSHQEHDERGRSERADRMALHIGTRRRVRRQR